MNKDKDMHIYLAIDSDILRAITNLNLQLKRDPNFDTRKSQDPVLQRRGGYIKYLLQAAQQDQIRLLIVTTIYQESMHSKALCNFIKEYCYFPNINAVNAITRRIEYEKLANLYCQPYLYKGEIRPAPMKIHYDAALQKFAPSDDVFAMAEATYDTAFFITNNGKDFIFDEKNEEENKDRTFGIIAINNQNGYYQTFADNLTITPKPMAIHTIGPMLKDPSTLIASMAKDSTKIKADKIM